MSDDDFHWLEATPSENNPFGVDEFWIGNVIRVDLPKGVGLPEEGPTDFLITGGENERTTTHKSWGHFQKLITPLWDENFELLRTGIDYFDHDKFRKIRDRAKKWGYPKVIKETSISAVKKDGEFIFRLKVKRI